jgi:endogenous inhibitor of DNA gyrase (YacG/DUF329 family)
MRTQRNSRPCNCCGRLIPTATAGKRLFCTTACRRIGEKLVARRRSVLAAEKRRAAGKAADPSLVAF